jgi:uncharacterized protein YutE (UPF0331/DUF86 family)
MARASDGSASVVDIDRMAAKLTRLPAQRRALRAALGEFGDDFDRERWAAAFESSEVGDINRVLAVTGGYTALVNNTIEAVKIGAQLADLAPTRGMSGASGIIDALHRDGGISAGQAETFVELYRTRNAIQHASPDIEADEIHRQVQVLLGHLPGFVKRYVAWLERHGVDLLGDA